MIVKLDSNSNISFDRLYKPKSNCFFCDSIIDKYNYDTSLRAETKKLPFSMPYPYLLSESIGKYKRFIPSLIENFVSRYCQSKFCDNSNI